MINYLVKEPFIFIDTYRLIDTGAGAKYIDSIKFSLCDLKHSTKISPQSYISVDPEHNEIYK